MDRQRGGTGNSVGGDFIDKVEAVWGKPVNGDNFVGKVKVVGIGHNRGVERLGQKFHGKVEVLGNHPVHLTPSVSTVTDDRSTDLDA